MGRVNVVIVDATGNKEQKVGLPDDIKGGIIMVKLVEKIKLPSVGPDGNPISYKFIHKVTGRQLLETQTLADAGIRNGDVLRLQPEITAGSGNPRGKKVLAVAVSLILAFSLSACDSQDYSKAMSAYEAGNYSEALAVFEELGDYKDSADMINACNYGAACELQGNGEYGEAAKIFEELGDYKDSADMMEECRLHEIDDLLQGRWHETMFSVISVDYSFTNGRFRMVSTISGSTISNEGSYRIDTDTREIYVCYDNTINSDGTKTANTEEILLFTYTYDNGEFVLTGTTSKGVITKG